MTWTLSDSGTTSALTIGTETTLATDTNNGTFVLEVDGSNMAIGDWLIVRAYTIYALWRLAHQGMGGRLPACSDQKNRLPANCL